MNLEKLGQYLRRENLQTCLTPEGSEWATMLDENHCLRDHPLIVKQDLNYSLLQSHAKLITAIHNVFREAYQGLVEHFTISNIALVPSIGFTSSQITINDDGLLVATCDLDHKILRLFKIECLYTEPVSLNFKLAIINTDHKSGVFVVLLMNIYNIYFLIFKLIFFFFIIESYSKNYTDCSLIDLQFYSNEYLSLLLLSKQTHASYLVQLPINHIRIFGNQDKNLISLTDLLNNSWPRPFQGISAKKIAVSGARKVAAVLSESNRKIRLLETEVEPEDEEDEEEEEDGTNDNILDTSHGTVPNSQ